MMGRYPALGPLRRPGKADRRAVDEALAKVSMADHAETQIGAPVGRPAAPRLPGPGPGRRAGPVPPRRAGDRRRRHDPGGPDGRPRGGGAPRQDRHRHDPRPGLRRPAFPARRRPSIGRSSPRARRRSFSIRMSWPGPTAGTCSSSAARRSCSTTRITTTSRPAASAISTTTAAAQTQGPVAPGPLMSGLLLDPLAYEFFLRALARVGARRGGMRSGRHLHGAARAWRSSATRSATRPFRAWSSAFILKGPFLPRRRRSRPSPPRWPSAGSRRRARIRGDTAIGVLFAGMFALGVFLFSLIPNYVGDLFGFLFGEVLAIARRT